MEMNRTNKLSLMRFMCNAAWGDVEVQPEERDYIVKVANRLGLDENDMASVDLWLKSPPPIDSVDPTAIPAHHVKTFLKEMQAIIDADGVVTDDEADLMSLMKELLLVN